MYRAKRGGRNRVSQQIAIEECLETKVGIIRE